LPARIGRPTASGRRACFGRGFVVDGETATHQIDILIHDCPKPVLFRDGDRVFGRGAQLVVHPQFNQKLAETVTGSVNK
jgi:hypothetical protein